VTPKLWWLLWFNKWTNFHSLTLLDFFVYYLPFNIKYYNSNINNDNETSLAYPPSLYFSRKRSLKKTLSRGLSDLNLWGGKSPPYHNPHVFLITNLLFVTFFFFWSSSLVFLVFCLGYLMWDISIESPRLRLPKRVSSSIVSRRSTIHRPPPSLVYPMPHCIARMHYTWRRSFWFLVTYLLHHNTSGSLL